MSNDVIEYKRVYFERQKTEPNKGCNSPWAMVEAWYCLGVLPSIIKLSCGNFDEDHQDTTYFYRSAFGESFLIREAIKQFDLYFNKFMCGEVPHV